MKLVFPSLIPISPCIAEFPILSFDSIPQNLISSYARLGAYGLVDDCLVGVSAEKPLRGPTISQFD